MTKSKLENTRKQPVASKAQRDRMVQTLARNVLRLYEDADQRKLFACLTSVMRDNGTTCVGAARTDSSPEGYHALVNDPRLCPPCKTGLALHLAQARLRDLAGGL
mgnify:CR=1 FL=1